MVKAPVDGDGNTVVEVHEGLLAAVPQEKQLHVQFTDIKGWVSTHVGPPSLLPSFKSKSKDSPAFRQIMYGISGSCRPGHVLALMGPSGSSKTSVLSVIGGRTPESVKMEGQILFNNEKLTKRIKKRVGYVLQDDLLYETLTVFETLYFAALLRLPADMSVQQKTERVETVISTLGLSRCRNTIVGGGFRRGVSGGERKRVSIGHELLINPSAIFLDEPTSGLDSTTAMHLLTTLRQLASGGRAVVTTIHQPSSRLYMQLDKLLLLSEGHVMYYGKADMAADWFEKLGYPLTRGVNQADFFLDLASGDVSTKKIKGEDARQHCIACSEKFLLHNSDGFNAGTSLSENQLGSELWSAAESRKILDTARSDIDDTTSSSEDLDLRKRTSREYKVPEMTDEQKTAAKGKSYGASWPMQYLTLFRRAIKVRRFEALSIQDLIQILCVSILSGLFWLQAGQTDTVYGAQNSNGLLFFLMMFAAMRAMLQALFVFPPEFKMILKERASGMYQVSSYYLARTSSDLPIDCSLPFLFVTITYWMGGLMFSARAYFETLFAILLLVLVAQSFGLLIGAIVPIPKTAQTLTTVVALTMVLVAGFFATTLPVWIGWLKYLSFIFYCYSLLLKIQYGGRDLYFCGTNNAKKASSLAPGTCTLIPHGAAVKNELRLQRDPDEAPWEAAALIAFLVVMRTLVYVALRVKTRSKVR